jgi:hypothetical protein
VGLDIIFASSAELVMVLPAVLGVVISLHDLGGNRRQLDCVRGFFLTRLIGFVCVLGLIGFVQLTLHIHYLKNVICSLIVNMAILS